MACSQKKKKGLTQGSHSCIFLMKSPQAPMLVTVADTSIIYVVTNLSTLEVI